jgi:hypothetical protein
LCLSITGSRSTWMTPQNPPRLGILVGFVGEVFFPDVTTRSWPLVSCEMYIHVDLGHVWQ